jgi:NAD(P)-dependent dehydrogenase (short-subunit alcohol dehydrogenase family)
MWLPCSVRTVRQSPGGPIAQRGLCDAGATGRRLIAHRGSRWLAPFKVTVNALLPGPIRTSRAISTNRREYGDDLAAGFRERAKAIPIGRFGT